MKHFFLNVTWSIALILLSHQAMAQSFNKNLQKYSVSLEEDFASMDAERKKKLQDIADYIIQSKSNQEDSKVLFVCTHNSRRSHFAQIWLQTAAYYYGVDDILTYSGGTEATAANERAMDALKRAGFTVATSNRKDDNHVYAVSQGPGFGSDLLFSKVYGDKNNPQERFGAVMVCSDADKSCPVVHGADARISLPFDDPRYYDNTPSEKEKYDETCRLIATEMFYAMSLVKEKEVTQAEKLK